MVKMPPQSFSSFALSTRWMCYSQVGKSISNVVLWSSASPPAMACLCQIVPTQTFLSFTSFIRRRSSLYCNVVLFIFFFCFLQASSSKDADCCCSCGSDCAECFLQPGLPVCPPVQTKPDPEPERHKRSEWRDRTESEEPAAHHIHPHRRPGVCQRVCVALNQTFGWSVLHIKRC